MIHRLPMAVRWTAVLLTVASVASADGVPDPLDRFRNIPILKEHLPRPGPPGLLPRLPGDFSASYSAIPFGTLSNEFGTPAINSNIGCVVYWNDSLVIGGQFTAAGATAAQGVALWDGTAWKPLGSLFYGVQTLAVWRGDLIATQGGNLMRWTGSTWDLIAYVPGWISALAVNDSVVVMGGSFYEGTFGSYSSRIVRWNGTTLTWMGGALDAYPNTIVAFQGQWYAGGNLVQPRPVGQNALVRFDGAEWQPFGGLAEQNENPSVQAMAVLGNELLVGGRFDSVASVAAAGFARWDGATWSSVPVPGPYPTVFSMAVERDSVVHMGAQFNAPGSTGLYRWNGAVLAPEPGPDPALHLASDGSRLAAVGPFSNVEDRVALQIAERNAAGWHPLEEWQTPMRGLAASGSSYVRQLVAYDGGVVASGSFTSAADDTGWTRLDNTAGWHDGHWQPMSGLGGYGAIELVAHDGHLFAMDYTVRQWTGVSWDPVGSSFIAATQGASVGGSLYAGSQYFGGSGSVWRWDDPVWTSLPQPDGIPATASVADMIGDGSNLIVSWRWDNYGRMTRWDGAAWTTISEILDGAPSPLAIWNSRLFAWSERDPSRALMMLDGNTWKPTGLTGYLTAFTTLGPWLVASGYLQAPGLRGRTWIAAWDGVRWMPLPIDRTNVHSVLGVGQSLWVGCESASNGPGGSVARWDWDGHVPVPPVNAFVSAAPNPFSTSVTLRFSLARLGKTRLAIYDIAGHEVSRLWNDVLGAGDHSLSWDGRDRKGNLAPAGVYFARLLLDDRSAQSQRIVLMR